jgi:tol-pal system protein YbgF
VPPPLAGSVPPTSTLTAPPGAATTHPPVRADGTEQSDYDEALNKLREGAYEEAITRLEGFQRSYPDSPLNGDALYWLGESYYVIRNFERARQTFLTLGSKYPDSKRLPDAMLKLGYIYEEQGDKTKAREVLTKLTQSYPNSAAATHAQRRLQAMK